jgi:hypothetical protein
LAQNAWDALADALRDAEADAERRRHHRDLAVEDAERWADRARGVQAWDAWFRQGLLDARAEAVQRAAAALCTRGADRSAERSCAELAAAAVRQQPAVQPGAAEPAGRLQQ